MSDFISKISGQIIGPLILGVFFPVLLSVVVFAMVVLPVTPFGQPVTELIQNGKLWDEKGFAALSITLIVLVLSVVLHSLNIPIIRLYEGYPWSDSWIGQVMTARMQKRLRQAQRLRKLVTKLRKEARIFEVSAGLAKTISLQQSAASVVNEQFPDYVTSVLPTRLGNVIRSFETYTRRQYGASAIALWPRLVSILDSDHAQAIEAVKTSFDFMLNTAFLSGVLALVLTGAGLYWQRPVETGFWRGWVAWDVLLIFMSWLTYRASIGRASEWGTQVKAAFDTNRRSLLDKLGFSELKPENLAEERSYWQIINQRLSFPDESVQDLPYKIPASYLIVEPYFAVLTFTRNVRPGDDEKIAISVAIANRDVRCVPADRVILREEIPDKKAYVPGSATVNGAPATLLSLNPLKIDVGALPYYESRIVTYTLKPQP